MAKLNSVQIKKVRFNYSSSFDPTEVSVYQIDDSTNLPVKYLLKKYVQATSGKEKTKTFTFGAPKIYDKIKLSDEDGLIDVIKISDDDGEDWTKVDYLGQDTVFEESPNTSEYSLRYSAFNADTPAFDSSVNNYTANVWTGSQTVAGTPEAITRWGSIKHFDTDLSSSAYLPAGPDLNTGRSGAQYFTFAFRRSTMSNFTVRLTGTVSGFFIAAPGTSIDSASTLNGWVDAGTTYGGSGTPGADTGNGGNGSNGVCSVTVSSGAVSSVSVTTPGTGYRFAYVRNADIVTAGATGLTGAELDVIIEPKGGHGFNDNKRIRRSFL